MEPAGKRIGPPQVEPAHVGTLRIEALHWGKERGLGQNGGYIKAVDERTGAEQWTLQVYRIDYDDHMEEDVQDIFIKKIERAGSDEEVAVTDERGRQFVVDVPARTVR